MFYSAARVTTLRPYRHVEQLVSHLGREMPAELGADGRGRVSLRRGGCLLASADKRVDLIVGCVSVQPKARLVESAHVFGITGLVVAAGTRRRGMASALLDAAEREAAYNGAKKLSLQVLGTNAAGMRLYARHGYVVEGRYVNE